MQGNIFLTEIVRKYYFPEEKTLLSCSGGADSTALFYLLLECREKKFISDFAVFHLNHQLRGVDSEKDALFVNNLCKKHNITCYLYQENIKEFAQKNSLSLEEAGRVRRYALLETIKKQANFHSITTAHHLDDNIETFFLHLLQGGGLNGLSGIQSTLDKKRPLLTVSKNTILDFLQKNNIPYCMDKSNEENQFLRNKVRNHILPVIKSHFPSFEKKILEFQYLLKNYRDYIKTILPTWEAFPDQVSLSLSFLKNYSEALWGDILLEGLKKILPHCYLSFKNIRKIIEMIKKNNVSESQILLEKKDFSIFLTVGKIFIVKKDFLKPNDFYITLKPYESIFLKDGFLCSHSAENLFLSSFHEGITVRIKNYHKKLSDYLSAKKIPFHWRKKVILIQNLENQIVGFFEPIQHQLFFFEEKMKNKLVFYFFY